MLPVVGILAIGRFDGQPSPSIIDNLRERIAEAAITRGLPTAGQISFYADVGFLLTYAPVLQDHRRPIALYPCNRSLQRRS